MKKTSLALPLALLLSNSAFAVTVAVKSPAFPLNGAYVLTGTRMCAGTSISFAGGPAQTFNQDMDRYDSGKALFTPDTTHTGSSTATAFANWLAYAETITKGVAPNYTANLDPTVSPASTYLTETPIEWGNYDLGELLENVTLPATTAANEQINSIVATPFFITSFKFTNAINTLSTGYALYFWNNSGSTYSPNWQWRRFVINFNKTTATASFASAITYFDFTNVQPNFTDSYQCIRKLQFNQ